MKIKGKDGFLDAMERLVGQQDSKLLKALKIIIQQCDQERQRWHNNPENRLELINKCEKSEVTINRYVGRLAESGILAKVPEAGRGIYKINEEYLEIMK